MLPVLSTQFQTPQGKNFSRANTPKGGGKQTPKAGKGVTPKNTPAENVKTPNLNKGVSPKEGGTKTPKGLNPKGTPKGTPKNTSKGATPKNTPSRSENSKKTQQIFKKMQNGKPMRAFKTPQPQVKISIFLELGSYFSSKALSVLRNSE